MLNLTATAETDIDASPADVWTALTDPDQIRQYMFGTHVETDWQRGSPIVWRGEYEGKSYVDKGEIVEVVPNVRLKVTHFSPLSGQPDVPSNYHNLTYHLEQRDGTTHVSLSQDKNGSEEEAEHSRENWAQMLVGLKKVVEER